MKQPHNGVKAVYSDFMGPCVCMSCERARLIEDVERELAGVLFGWMFFL